MKQHFNKNNEFLRGFDLTVLEYIEDILKEQEKLNSLFEENWLNVYTDDKLSLSCIDEFNELVSELTKFTRFYGETKKSNFDKAFEEYIDIVHFYSTRVLLSKKVIEDYELCVATQLKKVMSSNKSDICDELLYLHNLLVQPAVRKSSLCGIIALGGKIFDLSVDAIFTAYLHKNSKNVMRSRCLDDKVALDALKRSEKGTYDYLYESNIVSLSPSEFNDKLTWIYSTLETRNLRDGGFS